MEKSDTKAYEEKQSSHYDFSEVVETTTYRKRALSAS